MIKRIKLYFTMRKLERQMKYELLSKAYLLVSVIDQIVNTTKDQTENEESTKE